MNTAPSGIMQGPFVEPKATAYPTGQECGLRPKRLKFAETYPEVSRELYCNAPPIGRYEIFESREWERVKCIIRDDRGFTKVVAIADSFELAVAAAQSDFDRRMMEGLEDE